MADESESDIRVVVVADRANLSYVCCGRDGCCHGCDHVGHGYKCEQRNRHAMKEV